MVAIQLALVPPAVKVSDTVIDKQFAKLSFNEMLKKKGGQIMTVEELKKVYESIPPTSPINRARRAAIMQQILKLMEGGK